MGVLDSAILLGKETTYGTPVTPTRGYEGKADAFSREMDYLESTGFRPGLQTVRSDRRRAVSLGATGELEVDVMTQGMGLLFDLLVGATTGPTGSTAAKTYTFSTAANASTSSATVQVIRSTAEGSTVPFTYHGVVATQWGLSCEVGGFLVATAQFDAEDEDTTFAAGTPQYPANARPFDWTQVTVSVDGSPVDFTSFEVEAALGMKTDRRFLRGSALKRRPVRSEVPEITGTLNGEFRDTALFDAFRTGALKALKIEAVGDTIGAGPDKFKVTLDLPAVQFTGSSPTAALDDVTQQEVPFKVLWNGTAPAATLTYVTDDTAL